jgi:flavin reductase (DIM6/NTAB) family NADH-FMN oxidoreductase RutF
MAMVHHRDPVMVSSQCGLPCKGGARMADIVNIAGAAGVADTEMPTGTVETVETVETAGKFGMRNVVFGEGREIGKSYACLEKFTTGITVVTYYGSDFGSDKRSPAGLAVSLFAPISLDPPIVQISIEKLAKAFRELEGKAFTVNILAAEQEELALHFGGRAQNRLAIEWEEGTFSPRLKNTLAWLECTPSTFTEYGDHRQYIGEVYQFAFSEGRPLVYFNGKLGKMAE